MLLLITTVQILKECQEEILKQSKMKVKFKHQIMVFQKGKQKIKAF